MNLVGVEVFAVYLLRAVNQIHQGKLVKRFDFGNGPPGGAGRCGGLWRERDGLRDGVHELNLWVVVIQGTTAGILDEHFKDVNLNSKRWAGPQIVRTTVGAGLSAVRRRQRVARPVPGLWGRSATTPGSPLSPLRVADTQWRSLRPMSGQASPL
ncbi:hypothetical protein ACCAA_1010020 [Candidatus Accumulibacter aalborgensis]|uniref:Uncharacterized protein n=1 Tax=Candidatus Accumulibacter aalborgensis TaxID=1860102 RepID=A0A1A8XDZ9_9PROT|nr:hypothetical protein ACCAA_1010020 [Candidatus Accumulibacter aalborgensis]